MTNKKIYNVPRRVILRLIDVVFWLVNTSSNNNKTNHDDMCGKVVIFTGKSIYKRETVSNKNIGLVIK